MGIPTQDPSGFCSPFWMVLPWQKLMKLAASLHPRSIQFRTHQLLGYSRERLSLAIVNTIGSALLTSGVTSGLDDIRVKSRAAAAAAIAVVKVVVVEIVVVEIVELGHGPNNRGRSQEKSKRLVEEHDDE
jgi:hypothetical protein